MKAELFEKREIRNEVHIFKDRFEAGQVLAEMLAPQFREAPETMILAVPAGGVPIGNNISEELKIPFDLIIVWYDMSREEVLSLLKARSENYS